MNEIPVAYSTEKGVAYHLYLCTFATNYIYPQLSAADLEVQIQVTKLQ
jgi:hypothetical protein